MDIINKTLILTLSQISIFLGFDTQAIDKLFGDGFHTQIEDQKSELIKIPDFLDKLDIPKEIIDTKKTKPKINTVSTQTLKLDTTPKETPEQKTEFATTTTKTTTPIEQTTKTPKDILKQSTANILCSERIGNTEKKITGSAVAISNNGILLTNAHVGQYLLLEKYLGKEQIYCYVRTGSPAQKKYTAEIIFIPRNWILSHKNNLTSQNTSDTGENDFAILYLKENINNNADNLNHVSFGKFISRKGENVFTSGYPLRYSTNPEIGLYQLSDEVSVDGIWNLGNTNPGLFQTKETVVASNGSSGGGITDKDGKLIGLIFATVNSSGEANKILGITINHIENVIQDETGKTLSNIIKDADTELSNFASTIPEYAKILLNR